VESALTIPITGEIDYSSGVKCKLRIPEHNDGYIGSFYILVTDVRCKNYELKCLCFKQRSYTC